MSNLGTKIRQGTAWVFAGKFSTEMLNFAVSIVLARLLMPEHFGLVTTVGILTGLAGYFSGAGMGQALVRAKQVEQRHFDVMFTMQFSISTAIYLFFVLVSDPFAEFFGDPIYQSLLLVSGLSFFIRPFASLPGARLHREMRFRAMTLIGLATLTASSTASITLAWLGYGPWSLVIGGLVGATLNALMLNIRVRHRYGLAWDRKIAHEIGGYGAKVATNSLIEHFRGQSLMLILSKLNGPADVGLYKRASSLANMPMHIVGTAPYQAVFRALAAEQDNLDKSRYIYYRTITLVTTYTYPLFILAWWLAEPGIHFIYGEKWLASAEPLAVLALGGFFKCIGNPSGAVIEARNRMSAEIKLNIVAWLLLIAGAFYGLQWGLVGLAWASFAMAIFFNTSLMLIAGHELKGSVQSLVAAIRPAMLLSGLMLTAMWIADALFPSTYARHSPGLYAMLMSLVGGGTYAAGFLFLPMESLKTESAKWRSKLRLGR